MGNNDNPKIVVNYPDAGQYFGDQMYLRGFAAPVDNGSSNVRLYAGDQEIHHINGEFDTFADAALADENGNIELTAIYPDNETVTCLIPLSEDRLAENDQIEVRQTQVDTDSDNDESESDGIYNDVNLIQETYVAPGKDEEISFEGAKGFPNK